MPKTTNPLFQVHRLNKGGLEKAEELAGLFDDLLKGMERINLRDGRELALARTHLEEACFFAKKALASNPAHQDLSDGG